MFVSLLCSYIIKNRKWVKPLKWEELKKEYETVIGLGYWCDVAGHLKNHNLRTFSSPFDWVLTPSLSDINQVLKARFEGYMEQENMEFINYGEIALDDHDQVQDLIKQTYILRDNKFNITSVHDFPLYPNHSWNEQYPRFRKKLDSRINRFLKVCSDSPSKLFIRLEATVDEAVNLHQNLSDLSSGETVLLVINTVQGLNSLRENDLGINGVVFMEIPFISSGNFHNIAEVRYTHSNDWNIILKDITVKSASLY